MSVAQGKIFAPQVRTVRFFRQMSTGRSFLSTAMYVGFLQKLPIEPVKHLVLF